MPPADAPFLSPLRGAWVRALAGGLCGLAALELLAGVVVSDPHLERLDPLAVEPAPVTALSHLLAAGGGIGLLLLARALARGSRRAAQLAIALLSLAVLAGSFAGSRPLLLGIEAGAGALLLVHLRAFSRGTAVRAPRLTGALTVGASGVGYGLAVAAVLNANPPAGVQGSLSMAGAWLIAGSWWLHDGAPLAVALHGLTIVTVVGVIWWLHALLRPGPARSGHSPDDHVRAAAIVDACARDSLDPFALREDKSFFFAHGGLLAYRTIRETAVVSGDPIGPPGAAPAILAAFDAFATARGWDVVVAAASGRHLSAYRELGLRSMPIGEEGVVDVAGFSLEGPAMKTVRKAVRRTEREGWSARVVAARELTSRDVGEIGELERAWRSSRPRLLGFSMTLGRLWGAAEDDGALYVLGRDGDGRLRAFLRFERFAGGISLDAMRRTGTEPNGVTEALIVASIEYARDHGCGAVSLNFAGFSHLLRLRRPPTLGQRLGVRCLRLVRGRFQLERLARFNEKFGPRWERRYLVYRGRAGAPVAALRVLQAEAYVPAPRAAPVSGRWLPALGPMTVRPG